MATLQTRLTDLVTAVATDIKSIMVLMTGSSTGTLAGLLTTDKTSLVAAINEVKTSSSGAPPTATTTVQGVVELATLLEVAAGTDTTRAVTVEGVRQERTALRDELLNGAGAAYDTFKELQDALVADESTASALATTVGTKQDAAAIGNPDADLVAVYSAAKA